MQKYRLTFTTLTRCLLLSVSTSLVACQGIDEPPRPVREQPSPSSIAYQPAEIADDQLDITVVRGPQRTPVVVHLSKGERELRAECTLPDGTPLSFRLTWQMDELERVSTDVTLVSGDQGMGLFSASSSDGLPTTRLLYSLDESGDSIGSTAFHAPLALLDNGEPSATSESVAAWLAERRISGTSAEGALDFGLALLHDPNFFRAADGEMSDESSPPTAPGESDVAHVEQEVHKSEKCRNLPLTTLKADVRCASCIATLAVPATLVVLAWRCSRCALSAYERWSWSSRCAASERSKKTPEQCEAECKRQDWYTSSVSADEHLCQCTCDAQKCEDHYRRQATNGRTFCQSSCGADGRFCSGTICNKGFDCRDGQCISNTCPKDCPPDKVLNPITCACDCAPNLRACSDSCVDLQSDPLNCGACGATCSSDQECRTGTCACRLSLPIYRWETSTGLTGDGLASEAAAQDAGIAASSSQWKCECAVLPRQGKFPSWSITVTTPAMSIPDCPYYCPDVYVTAHCLTGTLDVDAQACCG